MDLEGSAEFRERDSLHGSQMAFLGTSQSAISLKDRVVAWMFLDCSCVVVVLKLLKRRM